MHNEHGDCDNPSDSFSDVESENIPSWVVGLMERLAIMERKRSQICQNLYSLLSERFESLETQVRAGGGTRVTHAGIICTFVCLWT
jgi:hypothetical protein